tara:strand:+ start:2149 stop:2691 length:543 start_codon:yes stop_codon:yes gene_type:complete
VSNSLTARQLAAIALMAALTAVGAWLRLPIPYVPVTLQMSFVYLSGVWLGSRGGALAQLVYVGAGLIGFPLFAKGGGLHYVYEPSFGYLAGFIPAAYVSGLIAQRNNACAGYIGAAVASLAMVYLPGLVWLHVVLNYVLGQETTLDATLALGLSSLPKDLALIPINAYLGKQIKRRISSL